MKILFTGGGSGGHFYPIIAVAESLKKVVKENKLIEPELYFMSTSPYNAGTLHEYDIKYIKSTSGKRRAYFSLLNYIDALKTMWGCLTALWKVFNLYPDVIFSKGGYPAFPVVFAAKILRIPLVIHESDSVPGYANQWAGKFADAVAVSFPEAGQFFDQSKVAHTGHPVRVELTMRGTEGAREYFGLEPNTPVVLILGGSQGSKTINDAVIDSLSDLVKDFQILHQTGPANIKEATKTGDVVLLGNDLKYRYHPFDYLNVLGMRMAAGAADVIVSRAGSTIFEIAAWGVPSILIPLKNSKNDHQLKNAFAYVKSGACEVIKEENLTPHILVAEIRRITGSADVHSKMAAAARAFFKPDAAEAIAKEILRVAAKHELS